MLHSQVEYQGGAFSQYMNVSYVPVGVGKEANQDAFDHESKEMYDVSELSGFFEQVGHNTDYIIHPEETMADNFAYLVTGKKVKTPRILEEM